MVILKHHQFSVEPTTRFEVQVQESLKFAFKPVPLPFFSFPFHFPLLRVSNLIKNLLILMHTFKTIFNKPSPYQRIFKLVVHRRAAYQYQNHYQTMNCWLSSNFRYKKISSDTSLTHKYLSITTVLPSI